MSIKKLSFIISRLIFLGLFLQFSGLESKHEITKKNNGTFRNIKKPIAIGKRARREENIPNEWDWTEHGAVTPVQYQGSCGSCYAFGTVAMLEGRYFLTKKKLVKFSESQIINCDKKEKGCNGGWEEDALNYIKEVGGLETQKDYPYDNQDNITNICKIDKKKFVLKVKKIFFVKHPKADEIKKTIYKKGPVTSSIRASHIKTNYQPGEVYRPTEEHCTNHTTHVIAIVGYGIQNEVKYWKCKNSWGTSFGDEGYFKIERGINACGIENEYFTANVV